jgi:hypothetical protein
MCIRACLSRQAGFDGSLASRSFDGRLDSRSFHGRLALTAATAPVICLDAKLQRAGGDNKESEEVETRRNAASTLPQPQVESSCKQLQGGRGGVASRQASCKQQRDQVPQRVCCRPSGTARVPYTYTRARVAYTCHTPSTLELKLSLVG